MEIFSGTKHAEYIDSLIKRYVDRNKSTINFGTIAVIQIGDNASSTKYINLKKRVAVNLGISLEHLPLSENLGFNELSLKIYEICKNPKYKSVIVQLPIPEYLTNNLLDIIPLDKDVDLLSTAAQKRFYSGDFSVLSPVVSATKYFLDYYDFKYTDKSTSIIGEGFLVGKPLQHYLNTRGVKTITYNEHSNVSKTYFDTDLIISAAGVPNLLNGKQFKPSALVIDFGSSVINGKTIGDVDLSTQLEHIRALSPSPGGMGPLVVRFLLLNHLNLTLEDIKRM